MREHISGFFKLSSLWSFLIARLGNELSWSIWAAITKNHRLGGLNTRYLFLTVLEDGKSKVKTPAYSVSGEGSLPSLQMVTFLLCPHITEKISLVSLFIRALISFRRAPHS